MQRGEPYERLAMGLFRELVAQSSVPNLRVEHDVAVQGKAGAHQIDVLWEFDFGGIRYLTLIQAKDWTRPVDQGEVLKFKAVLDDIPGQPRGVMVSKNGFQSGAEEIARRIGIKLYQLKEATEQDRPRQLLLWKILAFMKRYENVTPIFDREWCKSEGKQIGLRSKTQIRVEGIPKDIQILDADGRPRMRLTDAIRRMFPAEPTPMARERKRFDFNFDAFVTTVPGSALPKLKVFAVEADVWTEKQDLEVSLEFEAFATWLLKDLLEDVSTVFDEDGRPIRMEAVVRKEGVQWIQQADLPD